jgi:UDP-N-acetylmuramoyl-tripeptide--D-alanyl-D-alanine ligase
MIHYPLSQAAQIMHAELTGVDTTFTGLSTDSRSVQPGQLFFALRGEQFDGHSHAAAALAKGAAAVVLDHPMADCPQALVVSNTYQALAQLACAWRAQFSLPVLALTGSVGKTNVKEMLRTILSAATGDASQVFATAGNLNNHIGVPLMLAQLNSQHRFAVIECGMSHLREIAQLTRWVQPLVALINNAAPAHLEGVGSMAGIAQAKSEIFEGLSATGTAIFNGDDAFTNYWRDKSQAQPQLCFGRGAHCVVRGEWASAQAGDPITLHYQGESIITHLAVAGEHMRMNALAATAGALALGVSLQVIAQALPQYHGAGGRGVKLHSAVGATVIDDTYNANPASMSAAIKVLQACPAPRCLVLGQMAELGERSPQLHLQVLSQAKAAAFEQVLVTGDRFAEAAKQLGIEHFADKPSLTAALLPRLTAHTTVLIKGSRSSAMETVLHALVPHSSAQGAH